MKIKGKNGKEFDIVLLHKKIKAEDVMEHINKLIEEDTHILHNEKVDIEFERKWLKGALEKIKNKTDLYYILLDNKKLIGISGAHKGVGRQKGNVSLGISIAKEYRTLGLGEKLLKFVIKRAREKLNPRIIHLAVLESNEPAIKLYKKLGFREFARFPEWEKYKDKYLDEIHMKLE